MASNLGFNIFARDVNASRTFDEVGDSAERLERRLKTVGDGSSGLSARFNLLGDGASGLGLRLNGIGGAAAAAGVSLVATAGKIGIAAAAMASAANVAAGLVSALAPAVGILAALPGTLAAGVAAFGTLKLALAGVGDAFKAALGHDYEAFLAAVAALSPAAESVAYELRALHGDIDLLKRSVQEAFFAPLVGQLLAVGDALLPKLRDYMVRVAAEFGKAAQQVLVFARSTETIGRIELIFDAARMTVGRFSAAIQPLMRGFLDLSVVGAQWLAGLSGGIADAATRFGTFLSAAARSGQAMQWIENAMAVFKQLGGIAADVGGILKGIGTAMQSVSGGGALGVIGALADGFNKFANSAAGQQALREVFTALGQVGRSLAPVVSALVTGLGELAPVVADLALQIGPILTSAISGLVPALKALGPGVVAVFAALGQAVGELASSGALTEIGRALADILIALAPLLPALAQVLVPVLQGLAFAVNTLVVPALQTVVGWITGLAEKLSGASLSEDNWLVKLAFTIRDAVIPIWQRIQEVVGKVVADIAAWISANQATFDEWGERIISIVGTVGEIIGGVFEFISWAWDHYGTPLLNLVSGVFGGILQVIQGAMEFVKGLIEVVLGVITGDWSRAWEGLKTAFFGVVEAIKGILGAGLEILKFQVSAGLNAIGAKWSDVWNSVQAVARQVWSGITSWIGERVSDVRSAVARLAELPGQVSAWFGRIKDAIADKFGDAVTFVRSIPGRIVDALGNLSGLLYNSGRSIIQSMIDGLWSMFNNLWNTANDILGRIRDLFPFSPAREGPFSGKGWTLYSGMSLGEGFAEGMARSQGLVGRTAAGLARAAQVGVTAQVAPVVPAGVAAGGALGGGGVTFVFNFAGQPLIGRDEISRLVISALNEAKSYGFNLGALGASS